MTLVSERDVGTARTTGSLLVAGRYRLVALVGSGGMGRVWRAHDELLDRTVAVKEVLPPPELSHAAAVRTMSEARAAARLEHPGVVRIYDVVRTTGRSWIVMELVESESLQARLDRDGRLTHRETARIGLPVLDALRAAHAAGVLHRDVKPANILLAADGRVMLTDFGLAALDAAPDDGDLPLLASPNYIAPERLRYRVSSAETDLWSLGATLYTMVEGRPPFQRAEAAGSLAAIADEPPHPVRHAGPLHPLIRLLLTKDPARRPTAVDVHVALQAAAVPVPFRAAAVAPRASFTEPPVDVPEPAARSRRTLILAGAGAAAVVIAGGVTFALLPGPAAERAPVTAAVSAPAGACAGSAPEPAISRDPAGFEIRVPAGWTRSEKDDVVCFDDPGSARTVAVKRVGAVKSGPLQHWQTAERAAGLPGYRRISMGVLLVTGGGADWEYTWQPATGPRLHAHRYLFWANNPRAYEVSWTTEDADWTAATASERAVVGSVKDVMNTAPTWGVPRP